MSFFKHFPKVDYLGHSAVNILARTKMNKQGIVDNQGTFDYILRDGDRPDIIAYLAYQDSEFDWLVQYANDIVDPYHDWYMSTNNFNEYIDKKYGSLQSAINEVVNYKLTSIPGNEDRQIDHYGVVINPETFVDTANTEVYTYQQTTAFDQEMESNTNKLQITLLGEQFKHQAEEQLINALKD